MAILALLTSVFLGGGRKIAEPRGEDVKDDNQFSGDPGAVRQENPPTSVLIAVN